MRGRGHYTAVMGEREDADRGRVADAIKNEKDTQKKRRKERQKTEEERKPRRMAWTDETEVRKRSKEVKKQNTMKVRGGRKMMRWI